MKKIKLNEEQSRQQINGSPNRGRRGLKFLAVSFAALAWLAFGTILPNTSASSRPESLLVSLLDTTFGTGGIVITDITSGINDRANAVALQPDGKIIVAGVGDSVNPTWNLARYNADGSPDTTFDADGKLTLPLGGYATGVFLQTDGKIFVTGTSATGQNTFFTATRLNADGSLDTTFDADGIASTSFDATASHAGNAGILQPDGKIVVAGHLILSGNPNNVEDWAAARFNADGSLDTTFDADGKVIINVRNSDEAFGAALQTDGKIVIAGFSAATNSTGNTTLARLNTDGSLDTTFDGDGKVISTFQNNFATSVAIQPDGKIITAGSRFVGNVDDFMAERFNSNGSVDSTFGFGGRVVTGVSQSSDRANDIFLQPDGKFVLSGYAVVSGTLQFALARYNANGTIDSTFSGDGIETTQIGQFSAIAQSVLQPDGKIVVAGYTRASGGGNEDFALARYFASGAGDPIPSLPGNLDSSFDGDGKSTTNFDIDNNSGSSEIINSIAIQPDGKIVAAGESIRNGTNIRRFAIARYNADGSLDATFDTDGKLTMNIGVADARALAAAVQPDGKIVVAGNAEIVSGNAAFAFVRLNADGSLDATFGTGGTVLTDLSNGNFPDYLSSMLIQPDGKILAAGRAFGTTTTGSDFAVARYNTNGTLDTTFGTNGVTLTDFAVGATFSLTDSAQAMALQTDGKIVLAGYDGTNTTQVALARYNPNGTLDTIFGTGGKVTRNLSPGDEGANAVAIQPDGKIVAAGYASSNSTGSSRNFAVLRFNANGSVDNTFNTNGSVNTVISTGDFARAVLIQPDGKIVAVGLASPSTDKFALVRYNANGTLDTTFGSNGIVLTGFGSLDGGSANAAVLQRDGKIIAAGSATITGTRQDFALARYYAFTPRKSEFDFDGDGRADASVFRPSSGIWYLNRSTQGFYAAQFGLSSDKLAPADYDGDGKTDIAVWRGDSDLAYFYILNSSNNTFRFEQFGSSGDNPSAVGDWDADGKADLAVYRLSNNFFYYRPSSAPATNFVPIQWGAAGDVPTRGDFDGDGKIDAAVFRPSTGVWYVRQSSNSQSLAVQFGAATDKTVGGDFDGDGKTDIAVFRPSSGVWYVRQSSDNQIRAAQYGLGTDKTVAADYDGDGKTDIAVWRDGVYYILQSANSQTSAAAFGATTDLPAAAAFVQ